MFYFKHQQKDTCQRKTKNKAHKTLKKTPEGRLGRRGSEKKNMLIRDPRMMKASSTDQTKYMAVCRESSTLTASTYWLVVTESAEPPEESLLELETSTLLITWFLARYAARWA